MVVCNIISCNEMEQALINLFLLIQMWEKYAVLITKNTINIESDHRNIDKYRI